MKVSPSIYYRDTLMVGLVQSLFLVFGKDLLNFSWLFCIYKDRIGVAEAYLTIEYLFLMEF